MGVQIQRLKRAVIKEELVALTGDAYQAVILDRFITLTFESMEYDRLMLEEKARAESIGRIIDVPISFGWIYKKSEDLASEIMIINTARTVRQKVTELVEKGYLLERNSDEYRFERTKQYKVDMDKISQGLELMGYRLDTVINQGGS